MKALIHGTRVCQIEDQEFPVANPLVWIDCDETVTTQHTYEGGQFIPPNPSDLHECNGSSWEVPAEKQTIAHNRDIDRQIAALEATVTPRRMREAIRGSGKAWLDAVDTQIANLRAQRV